MKLDRNVLLKLIEAHQTSFPEEEAYKIKFQELLTSNNDCFLRKSLNAHITASAWIVDEDFSHALLLHHSKLNRWLQPGGHADGVEDLFSVVRKEVIEETGIDYTSKLEEIFDLDIHSIPERKGVPRHDHYDVRFLMIIPINTEIQRNEESNAIGWKMLEQLRESKEIDQSIYRLIDKTHRLRENNKEYEAGSRSIKI